MAQFTFYWPSYFGVIKYSSSQSELSALTWEGALNKGSLYQGPYKNSAWKTGTGRSLIRPGLVSASVDGETRGVVLGTAADAVSGYCGFVRTIALGSTITDGYFFYVQDMTNIGISRYVGGTYSILSQVSPASLGVSFPMEYRIQAIGSTIRFKVWNLGKEEPSAWSVTVTDTGFLGSGYCGIGAGSNFRTVFSDFSIGTGADAAPSLNHLLEGSVFENGIPDVPVERVVRAVSRSNIDLRYETTSLSDGSFRMFVRPGSLYSVFALDEESGDYNALIADKIAPIPI